MPRELITIQVGQCGNQVGCRFWELALREHSAFNISNKTQGYFDDSMSTFFRNVDTRFNEPIEIPAGKDQLIKTLKARAILVDMEEGVLNQILRGPLHDLFDCRQLIKDVSGSGNNWAEGFFSYGDAYIESIMDVVRRTVESCDSLLSFFMFHSLGGGTGSGLGSRMLAQIADEYSSVERFTISIYPSANDDVITSPYNSLLAQYYLSQYSSCVIPIANSALEKIAGQSLPSAATKRDVFDNMNSSIASMITNLTCSMRFAGSLNVDLNEITMNLVPFPNLHYLLASMTPLKDPKIHKIDKNFASSFSSLFSRDSLLCDVEPKNGLYLACGIITRGKLLLSDVNKCIEKMKPNLNMISWNMDGFKTGHCFVPAINNPYSLLSLTNNTAIKDLFLGMQDRFQKLYKRRAHVHHYMQVKDVAGLFDDAFNDLSDIVHEYNSLQVTQKHPSAMNQPNPFKMPLSI